MMKPAHDQSVVARARGLLDRLTQALAGHPALSVALSVLSFSFFGPLAALVVVATMIDHEFGHRLMMNRLGYKPGPVRVVPFLGAFVRAGRPLVRSADIALIYLAGPLAGVLSATAAALLANRALSPDLAHQVAVGAAVSIALNLFNLIPVEPLDGGLIVRVLPYPALLLFPGALALWLVHSDLASIKLEVVVIGGATWITVRKIAKWRRYLADLHRRVEAGDERAARELRASLDVPLLERVVVVATYGVLVPVALHIMMVLSHGHHWLPL
jgi:Zn-dependent protease